MTASWFVQRICTMYGCMLNNPTSTALSARVGIPRVHAVLIEFAPCLVQPIDCTFTVTKLTHTAQMIMAIGCHTVSLLYTFQLP